jgi:hypothetical protein
MSDDTKSGGGDSSDKSGTDRAGTGRTLEQIRAEYDAALRVAQGSKGKEQGDPEIAALKAEMAELRADKADRSYRQEMDKFIVPTIAGETGVKADLVEMWVNKQASDNPELMELWNERASKRAEFKKAIEDLKPKFEEFAAETGLVRKSDKGGKASGDGKREAAVRSARSTPASQPKDFGDVTWGSLSDTEFARKSQEVFAAVRTGQLQ